MSRGLVTLTLVVWSFAALAANDQIPQAPRLEYVPPPPGSYALPAIQRAPNGVVLAADGTSQPLALYTTGRITLLSFIYTYCTDPVGCPLAYNTFVAVRARLLERPELARHVRLVSLSFDPTHDTPEELRAYGGKYLKSDAELTWSFLTTHSVKTLMPLLDGFGQDVAVELDERGRPTRAINHMLKVFLIDRHGAVREIYSVEFLFPEVVLNDIKTLLIEEGVNVD